MSDCNGFARSQVMNLDVICIKIINLTHLSSNHMSLDKHAVYVRISEHQESPEGRFFNQGEGKVVIGNEVAYVSLEAGNIQFILLKKIFGRS